jgi:membrane-associated phospholipid phosphatase
MFAIILLTLRETLLELDRELFTFINDTAASSRIDWLFVLLRNAITWIPLYVFVLYWIIRNYKKYAWQFVLMSLVLFAITDYTSASIFKPLFMRVRPCFDTQLETAVRDLVGCGGRYGMPSSHSSNHFGLASFWYFSVLWMSKRTWWWLWLWAFLIGYSQVYVGKHFPGDIIVGAILGTTAGVLFSILFKRWLLKTKTV